MIAEVSAIATTIASAVEEQGAATAEIAATCSRRPEGTRHVTTTIVSVGRAADHTGSAAAEVLEAAGQLSRQAKELSAEASRFVATVRAA